MGERKRAVSKNVRAGAAQVRENVRAGAARVRENVQNFRVFRLFLLDSSLKSMSFIQALICISVYTVSIMLAYCISILEF